MIRPYGRSGPTPGEWRAADFPYDPAELAAEHGQRFATGLAALAAAAAATPCPVTGRPGCPRCVREAGRDFAALARARCPPCPPAPGARRSFRRQLRVLTVNADTPTMSTATFYAADGTVVLWADGAALDATGYLRPLRPEREGPAPAEAFRPVSGRAVFYFASGSVALWTAEAGVLQGRGPVLPEPDAPVWN
ncbi:MAG: hypothetical protein ACREMO_11100 [Gemmatimonadales bacterium]